MGAALADAQEGVAQALVVGGLAVGGNLLRLFVQRGARQGVGIRWELGRDGALGVVKTEVATLVLLSC